jgi:protocatechuate 3,4-dioxygenase alpha subunit
MTSKITTSQTIGPFPHEGWRWGFEASAPQPSSGAGVVIGGVVYDGDGVPVGDAVLEAWSPAAAPAESGRAIPGFRRVPTNDKGEFRFEFAGLQSRDGEPAVYLTLFARGLLKHQFSAVFLEDDVHLENSPLLAQVSEPRRVTLIAKKTAGGEYRWDLRMQGDRETVFFDYE